MVRKLTDTNKPNTYVKSNIAIASNNAQIVEVTYSSCKYHIIFDGYIYNSEEIKKEILKRGISLKNNTVEELVLNCYILFKESVANMLDGIFAFAIFDEKCSSIYVARDALGFKPLFYTDKFDLFAFSSEIKGLLQHPDVKAKIGKDQICEIFGLGPAHSPGKTFFKDIYELKPGHYGILNEFGFTTHKYWDLETATCNDDIDTAIKRTKHLVISSFDKQFSTSACSMLSGGLDSSILTMLAFKKNPNMQTFSINFEGNEQDFNSNDYQPTKDSDYVKIMTEFLKVNHRYLYFNNYDLFNTLKDAVIAKDMPGMADIDSSMLVLCRKIKEEGYDICISGECSDEIFGGYPWYYKPQLVNSDTFPWARSLNVRSKILNNLIVSESELSNYITKAYSDTVENVVYSSINPSENTFRKNCYLTIKWFMNTLVERTVFMSRMARLEVRTPFADKELFQYIYNIPYNFKLGLIANSEPIEKYVLRKAFENDLPQQVAFRKKSPFPKTYDPKYLNILEKEIDKIISSYNAPILQLINVKYLQELLSSHGKNLQENWFGQLMTYPQTLAYLIQVNIWLEEYNIEVEI